MTASAQRTFLAAVVVAVVGLLAACAPPPPDEGFSDTPADLAAFSPGEVVRDRAWSFTQDAFGRTPAGGVSVRQLLYRSANALGEPIAVTGTVLVPTRPWAGPGPRPLVSYAVGTRGIGDDCAPSKTLAQGLDYEGGYIVQMLDRGWAVAVSDMEGLGTAGDHTYMVGRSQGHVVLDMARAALALPGSGLAPDAPVGIIGYSQGGATAGWAAQLAPAYAPELNLVGVAAGGVPADLEVVAASAEGSDHIALVLITALGFDAAYPELELDSYLNARGNDLVERGHRFCFTSLEGISTFLSVAGTRTDDFVSGTNPLTSRPWRARLAENRLGGIRPTVPVMLGHGRRDTWIPFSQAQQLRKEWCASGANVTWRTYPFADHVLGILANAEPALAFIGDRFEGRTTRGNCR